MFLINMIRLTCRLTIIPNFEKWSLIFAMVFSSRGTLRSSSVTLLTWLFPWRTPLQVEQKAHDNVKSHPKRSSRTKQTQREISNSLFRIQQQYYVMLLCNFQCHYVTFNDFFYALEIIIKNDDIQTFYLDVLERVSSPAATPGPRRLVTVRPGPKCRPSFWFPPGHL